jgi:hypothetical protein
MNGAFNKLDNALGDVIQLVESEERAVGGSEDESELLRKLRTWRDELVQIRTGGQSITPSSGSRSSSRPRGPAHDSGLFRD